VNEPAVESDLEKARRFFVWDSPNWRLQAIEAYALSMAERRYFTALLEAEGEAPLGAGAFEFADPPEPAPANPATSAQEGATGPLRGLHGHKEPVAPGAPSGGLQGPLG
jgi:hypothetical protein